MQQLTIEHKNKTTTDQKVVDTITKKDRRPGKGRAMALSRRIYRLQNTNNMYYVESETSNDQYYSCKFKPDVLDSWYCSCEDNSIRHLKCKHLFAIEFAIKWGTIKYIDKVPLTVAGTTTADAEVKRDTQTNIVTKSTTVVISAIGPKSYIDDDYTF